jgi:AraC-like DNA-binding protein
LQAIAEKLHLSTRSLQRKLKDEGHTFLAIANDIQEQRAVHLLRQTQLNISEVAYMLGYAEPSVFRRAFKRWTGKTPKEYLKN